MEKAHEEHYTEEYRNGNETKTIRKVTKTHEKSSISSPMPMSKAMQKGGNAIMANQENGMALMKATPGSSSGFNRPYCNDIALHQETACNMVGNSGTKVMKQIITTTTTTTTTTIIEENSVGENEVDTPQKCKNIQFIYYYC